MNKKSLLAFSTALLLSSQSFAAGTLQDKINSEAESQAPALFNTFKELHQNPELSLMEKNTSKKLADEMTKLGFKVTENFGGYGVVAVLKNGFGPTVLIRTDMDALPLIEKTDLDYSSKVTMKNHLDIEMPAAHSCGHDLHMTVWLGVAKTLKGLKKDWKGTVVMIAQPAEELVAGARLMLDKKLYKVFPKPNYALALHTDPLVSSGKISYQSGYITASADTVDIEIYGVGGHGAMPEATVDPVVIAAQIVLNLQTIVSRNISPLDTALVSVGAINGGTKSNIIPDLVSLKITVRAQKEEVREKIFAAIKRITDGTALAAGVPKDKHPKVIINKDSVYVPSIYNDPILHDRLLASFIGALGANNVLLNGGIVMGSEDFALYKTKGVPITMFRLGIGASDKASGDTSVPGLHSPLLKVHNPELAIQTGIKSMSTAAINLLQN